MKSSGPLIPTLSLAGGIVCSYTSDMSIWIGIILIVLAIGVYIFIQRKSSNPVNAFKMGKWHIVWVILLFSGVGIVDEAMNRPLNLEESYGRKNPKTITGEVTGVLSKTYGDRIDITIEGTNGAKARIRTGVTELSQGDLICIPSNSLIAIEKDTTEIGKRIAPTLKANGILYTGWVSPKSIRIEGKSNSLRYTFTDLRERIETKIERSHLQKSTSDFINAILMGDKSGLDQETRLTFANGGTAHMLALSGLHLGILAGFLLFMIWPLKLAGKYKWGYASAIVLLWLYVFVTGLAYSSVRACIMITFAFVAIILERKNYAGNALSSACLLILLFDPSALFDVGFQLSVVCVGALIAFASRLNPIRHRQHPILYTLCGALLSTIVATAASWPLTSHYFSQVPLMFLPTNVLLLPLLPFYLAVAVVFVLLLSFGVEIRLLTTFLDKGYHFLLYATKTLSGGTEFVIDYQMPLLWVAIWMLTLCGGAWFMHHRSSIE